MAVNIHITIIELNALHTKRQNLFQELDAVIHLLMEAKHWGLRKSRNATSLNSRFKSLDTLKVKIISVTFRRVIRTNHKKASKIWRHENIQLGDRKSGSAGMPRPISYAVFCLKKKKEIDVEFPVGKFVCVTGVSGSGKSTLVNEIVYKACANRLNRMRVKPGAHEEVEGIEVVDKVIDIDQKPIGRKPRSNPFFF